MRNAGSLQPPRHQLGATCLRALARRSSLTTRVCYRQRRRRWRCVEFLVTLLFTACDLHRVHLALDLYPLSAPWRRPLLHHRPSGRFHGEIGYNRRTTRLKKRSTGRSDAVVFLLSVRIERYLPTVFLAARGFDVYLECSRIQNTSRAIFYSALCAQCSASIQPCPHSFNSHLCGKQPACHHSSSPPSPPSPPHSLLRQLPPPTTAF